MADLSYLPEAPQWFAIPPSHLFKQGGLTNVANCSRVSADDAFAEHARRALDKLARDLASTSQGNRNGALNKAAYTMGGFAATGTAIDPAEVESRLRVACEANGLIHDDGLRSFSKTFKSGFESGLKNPMPIEEAPEDEILEDTDSLSTSTFDSEVPDGDVTTVPGLVGAITDWIVSTSRRPSRMLAIGAALAAVGTLADRRYRGPTGLRTNLYVLAIAGSGFGKDHPRKQVKRLFAAARLDKYLGGESMGSGSGLRNRVQAQPSILYLVDEFGGLLKAILGRNAKAHHAEIRDLLLKYFSSADSIFTGTDYAGELGVKVYFPNVNVMGSSTPEDFYAALTSAGIGDGFLPRFILADAGPDRPRDRDPVHLDEAVPDELIDQVEHLMSIRVGGNLAGCTSDGSTACPTLSISFGEGSKELWREAIERCEAELDRLDPKYHPVLARVAEHALKMAGVVAIGVDPEQPTITRDIMDWALRFAWQSARQLIREVEQRVADNPRQEAFKKIWRLVGEAGPDGLTLRELKRRLGGSLDQRTREELINELKEVGHIEEREHKPLTGRPSKRLVSRRR